MQVADQKYIYIVVSKTNTILGKIIQRKLNIGYNHSSISLDDSLENIYSFGRKQLFNFLNAGFVCESKERGFFKQYANSKITVLKVPVTDEQWQTIDEMIKKFKVEQHLYKYSALGLIFCYYGIPVERKYKYFCSQFVAELLSKSNVYQFEKQESLVKPHEFLKISKSDVIYSGEIGKYNVV